LVGPVSPLGTMLQVMAGITLSFRLKGADRVGMVFHGDGASSTGAWHEGLGVAAALRCPLILMVEANAWAFSTPTAKQTRVGSFVEKAPAYGVRGVSVDGNDPVEVHEAVREAAARVRAGEGPRMVELRTYRRKGHAQHDPQDYVDADELRAWEEKDPVEGMRRRLVEAGLAGEEELDGRRAAILEEIREAAQRAVAEPLPDGVGALDGVYADVGVPMPWTRLPVPDPGGRVSRAATPKG
ncbi:MAG TPA: thiamine pyrophosphate-dependent dehydrogenase E1 component subunit alpha, partial [Longimicrobiales bacterium]|nr:thiamine pyrophosphate-dependent dehydrogenase E1 component subunit alpha [Longimicrobiales bacterium]